MDGLLIIRKEKGCTSQDVVARVRRICHIKKAGHTGTLDPLAEGVLPVLLGKATRLADLLNGKDKTYEAVMRLGLETDTLDITGKVERESEVAVTEEQVRTVLKGFMGESLQVPPMYSARRVNGKRLYELAREGKTVEREATPITVYQMEILETDLPRVRFRVRCSRGTYIRSLCRDAGEALGCGACMEELIRTQTEGFTLEESHTLEEVETCVREGRIDSLVIPLEDILSDYPRICVSEKGDRLLLNGNPLDEPLLPGAPKEGRFRLCTSGGDFVGIYQWQKEKGRFCPVKMLV